MNMDKLSLALRKAVGVVHTDYFRDKTISKEEFEARRDRLNKVLCKTVPHRRRQKQVRAFNERLAKTRRFMAYRRADIANGARVIIVLNLDDENVTLLQLDGKSVDLPVAQFKQSNFKKDVLVAASFVKLPVRIDRGIDLFGVCSVLGINPEGGVIEALANHIGIPITDRLTTIRDVTEAVINDFDRL